MNRTGFALAGYFGFGNAGDDLIRRAVTGAAPRLGWMTLGPDVSRWNPVSLASLFSRVKALVYGGGELFQSRTSFRSLAYYAALPRAARFLGARFAAYGMGFDPQLSGAGLALSVKALDSADRLWFRDADSRAAYEKGGGTLKSGLAPDPVWALPLGEPSAPPASLRRVLWIPRDPASPERIRDLSSRAGGMPGILLLHPRRDRRFFRELPGLENWDDPAELPALIGSYDAVVSMRYHGLLLAVLAGRPAVALAAHPKTVALAKELGFPSLGPEASSTQVAEALQSAFERRGEMRSRVEVLRDGARRGLRELVQFLEGL